MVRREASTDPRAVRTHDALVNATIELLEEQPASDLSVTTIVQRARVSRQVFYEHFADRDAVLLAAGKAVFGPVYVQFADHFAPDEGYPHQVAALITGLRDREPAVRALIDSSVQGEITNYLLDILAEVIEPELRRYLDKVGPKVEDGMVQDTARFLAAGTQAVFKRGLLDHTVPEEVGMRIETVRRVLGAAAQS